MNEIHKVDRRKSIFFPLHNNQFVEMCQWINGDGFDITIETTTFKGIIQLDSMTVFNLAKGLRLLEEGDSINIIASSIAANDANIIQDLIPSIRELIKKSGSSSELDILQVKGKNIKHFNIAID